MRATERVADQKAPIAHTGHRVTRADLDELRPWLESRLFEKFPHKAPFAIFGWLVGCMTQNDMLFVRAGSGIALVQLHKSFLSKFPWCETVFVLAKEGFVADASGLFQNIYDWADRERCTHLIIDEKHCDVERADVGMEIGTPKRVPTSVVFFPLHHAQDTTDV
jgi:hypothetical protein